MRAAVIVLGDLGRSPRMQYHALALAVNGAEVDLIGLEGAPLAAALRSQQRIRAWRLADRRFQSRSTGSRMRFVALSAARAMAQAAGLLSLLLRIPAPDLILVQNPPAVPTLAIAWLAARLRRARLIIDWHNLAHSQLAVRLGDGHRATRALARSERRWARRADAHLAVSQALAEWLARTWNTHAHVMHDRPVLIAAQDDGANGTLWNRLHRELGSPAERRPLIVCPSSWTPDEDFDLLLEALERTERVLSNTPDPTVAQGANSPLLVMLLTGRGPLRAAFEQRLSRRRLARVCVRTVWLEPDDYMTLIAMADAGLCLHQSSSGLDLPIKLADFRAAAVPALALDFAPVLAEVVTPGHEGVTFRDPGELASLLVAICGFPEGSSAVDSLAQSRAWLAAHPPQQWLEQWTRVVKPLMD